MGKESDLINFSLSTLDRLMPMHVLFDIDETILHVGPTITKICRGQDLAGQHFFDIFEARRQRPRKNLLDACERYGRKIYLRMRDRHRTSLIGSAVVLPDGKTGLVNFSFGISVVDAVQHYGLAGADFSANDLTPELLYLVESNSAALAESARLNDRLFGAKNAAEADAASDVLTGLQNRRVLDQVLSRLMSRNIPFALMNLDLDFFKAVNDTLGHAAGDHVLKEVARILIEETREEDTVARVGGDEFVLVFDRMTDRKKLEIIATRIIKQLEVPIEVMGGPAHISGSIGLVCTSLYETPDAAQMMKAADVALYASKKAGRARFTFYDPSMQSADESAAESADEADDRQAANA